MKQKCDHCGGKIVRLPKPQLYKEPYRMTITHICSKCGCGYGEGKSEDEQPSQKKKARQ